MSSISTDAKKRCKNCFEYVKIYITCFKCDAVYHIYCWKKVPGAYVNERGQLFCCHGLTSNYRSTDTNLGSQDNPPERIIEKKHIDDYNEDLKNFTIKVEDFTPNEFKFDACLLDFTNKEDLESYYSEFPEGESIQELKEDKDLENFTIKVEDFEPNEFKFDACLLDCTNKEHLESHYSECSNKEGKSIQELSEDKDLYNCLHKEEDLEWNEFQCAACLLEFTNKEHLKNHYSECPNKEGESIQELNEDKAGLFCSSRNEENFHKESYEHHVEHCHVENSHSRLDKDNDICIINTKRDPAQVDDKEGNYNHTACNYSAHLEGCAVKPMHIHNNERSFKCNVAGYMANKSETLTSHFSSKHCDGKEKYYSGVCVFSTPSEDTFGSHRQIYTNVKLFKCSWCDYAAVQRVHLKIHIKSKHPNANKAHKCTNCKFSTDTKNDLVRHIRTHTNEKPFKCDMCDYATARNGTLNVHIMARHSNGDKKYKCKDCEYSTHTKANLVNHILGHTNEKPFKCDTCDYATAQRGHLKNHILIKHSNADKEYKCRDCKYSTHKRGHLVNHIRIHTNEKPFKCDMCDYATARKDLLNVHIKVKHSNAEKEYKCKECKYSTDIKKNLVRHIRTHTNEKPFKCDMCDYAGAEKAALKGHVLAKHSNAEKMYKCGDCEYSSHKKNNLLRHKRTHTNKMQFR